MSVPAQARHQTVGDVAATLAGAAAVFRKHKIDFCCGGAVALDEAARKRGIDPEALRKELDALAQVSPDVPTDSAALCDHIVKRYHDVHRRELPELIGLAKRVEAVHRDHPLAPKGLADALAATLHTLLDHMTKEERILFPSIRDGFAGSLFGPIAVMRHEHDHHGEEMRAVEVLAHGFNPPDGACNSWRALYAGLDKFAIDFAEHVHLENNVLFPRFERARART
jgi:regulator of cell morphogenesis and NO signaling